MFAFLATVIITNATFVLPSLMSVGGLIMFFRKLPMKHKVFISTTCFFGSLVIGGMGVYLLTC